MYSSCGTAFQFKPFYSMYRGMFIRAREKPSKSYLKRTKKTLLLSNQVAHIAASFCRLYLGDERVFDSSYLLLEILYAENVHTLAKKRKKKTKQKKKCSEFGETVTNRVLQKVI